jgi:uncharacterized protein YoxC
MPARISSLPVWVLTLVLGIGAALALTVSGLQMLAALDSTDRSLARMETSLVRIDQGVAAMDASTTGLEQIDTSMDALGSSTSTIALAVAESRRRIGGLAESTRRIGLLVGAVGSTTNTIDGQIAGVSGETSTLSTSVARLAGTVTPLVASTASVRRSVDSMAGGINGMNGSLHYVIRVLDYLAAPPAGGGFSVRVTLDPRSIPPVPGIEVATAPVGVFTRHRWQGYTGP